MAFVGEVEGEQGGFELGMAQVALDEPGMHAGFEPRRGIRMPQGRDGHAHFGDLGPVCGFAAGARDAGAPHRRGRRRTVGVIAPDGRKEPGRVTVSFPVSAEPREGRCGQGDVPVFGTLAPMDMNLEALAIDVRDLQGKGFMEPEAQAVDGGAGDLVVQGGGGGKEPPDLLHTEDGWQTVGGLRA
jgi:hypothetical protein